MLSIECLLESIVFLLARQITVKKGVVCDSIRNTRNRAIMRARLKFELLQVQISTLRRNLSGRIFLNGSNAVYSADTDYGACVLLLNDSYSYVVSVLIR